MVRLLLILAVAGCYHPNFIDCTVACGENDACPEGLSCQDGMCAQPRKELLACGPAPSRQLAVGGAHACLIKFDATIWCWGKNDRGQIGDNTTTDRTKPTAPLFTNGWAAVTAGENHTCALRRDGSAYCWGENGAGQLGVGDMNPHASPMPLNGKWVTLTAASDRTCGTQKDGTLWCWGRGDDRPKQVGEDVAFAGAGEQLLCTLSPDRALSCPDVVAGSWEKISVGAAHFCAIDSAGSLFCSGADDSGQIGDGAAGASSSVTLANFRSVSAGAAQTCAIRNTGALACWGKNDDGRLGDGSTDARSTPTPIGSDSDWILVQTGGTSTCGAHANGRIQCWGANDHGQIGDGTVSPRPVPTDVSF